MVAAHAYRLRLRQTRGLMGSIGTLMGLDIWVPDYSMISDRTPGSPSGPARRTDSGPDPVVGSLACPWRLRRRGAASRTAGSPEDPSNASDDPPGDGRCARPRGADDGRSDGRRRTDASETTHRCAVSAPGSPRSRHCPSRCREDPPTNPKLLQCGKEALGNGIVQTVASTTHRGFQVVFR